jgi:hypothetical protein
MHPKIIGVLPPSFQLLRSEQKEKKSVAQIRVQGDLTSEGLGFDGDGDLLYFASHGEIAHSIFDTFSHAMHNPATSFPSYKTNSNIRHNMKRHADFHSGCSRRFYMLPAALESAGSMSSNIDQNIDERGLWLLKTIRRWWCLQWWCFRRCLLLLVAGSLQVLVERCRCCW